MTSTRGSASTDRMLRRFAVRRPEWFAVLISLAYVLPVFLTSFVEQEQFPSLTASPVLFATIAWCVVFPAVLLTALGWWGIAGFTRRSTWRSLVPFLPLVLLLVVPSLLILVLAPGVASRSPGYFALVALTMLATAFGQEATFRGVVLQTLLPRGRMRAVLLSAALSGVVPIVNLPSGDDPVFVGVQVLVALGMGVAFAAVVVVTGTIWPLVVISAAQLFLYGINPSPGSTPAAADSGADAISLVGSLVYGALVAAYGVWLLHRDQRRHTALTGEDDQVSAPQESPAA